MKLLRSRSVRAAVKTSGVTISSIRRVNSESVLNGIAYDAKGDRLFVTGKQWPAVFEIKVISPVK